MSLLDAILKKKKTGAAESASVSSNPTTALGPETKNGEEKKPFVEGLVSTKDIIAPSSLEVDFDFIRIDNRYYRTVFMVINRRFVEINWLSTLINFDASQTVTMYIYPTDGKEILDDLRRKIAEMEAEISTDVQRGRVINPATQAKLEDALNLQADLVKGEERFFQMGLYVTITADSKEELNRVSKNLEAALGALMILSKNSTLQMEDGFVTTLPVCTDRLNVTRNMDTTSLATTFPFVSSDLSDDKGIMYGINEHNGSLVIFDRFSMPNYNSVVFATAGAGKSYMIKLEAIRSLMLGTDIIVIDPENEYKDLCESAGGQYVAFGYNEESKINPFDLSLVTDEGENALNAKILNLHKLFKIMIGDMDPIEESILDRAIMDAYKMKGVTPDPETQSKPAPLIEDLYKSLIGMEETKAQSLAARFEKFIKGSFAGIFNQKTTVNLNNRFVVFGIKNLEESLRPVAMHIILDYIWTVVKNKLQRRILIVDEAWYLMQYPDSASFLRGIVKRGRKYYLGVTTITQDVDDFLETPYGKEIVTNSSIQILLKQHSAAIDLVGDVFYLSEGEKQLLLSADKGEGIFFAGQNHVAIRIISSPDEHRLITSNPEEVLKMKQLAKTKGLEVKEETPLRFKKDELKPQEDEISITQDKEEEIKEVKEAPVANQNETITPSVPVQPVPEKVEPNLPPTIVEASKNETTETVNDQAVLTEKQIIFEKTDQEKEVTNVEKAAEEKPVSLPETKIEPVNQPSMTITPNANPSESTRGNVEEVLSRRIKEMEAEEQKKIEEHEKSMAEEAKLKEEEEKKKQSSMSSLGGLPKYQDLFKAYGGGSQNKLPPLPPLPKFEPPKVEAIKNDDQKKKVTFVNTSETQIPQPQQLAKKPKPEFVNDTKTEETGQKVATAPPIVKEEIKAEAKEPATNIVKQEVKKEEIMPNSDNSNPKPFTEVKPEVAGDDNKKTKLSYDDLFGNGIV